MTPVTIGEGSVEQLHACAGLMPLHL